MRYVVFHSRTGAAAVVAALQFLDAAQNIEGLRQKLQHLPERGKFFVRDEQSDLVVLALASGKERFVLHHAVRALTKQFRPDAHMDIHDLTQAEWPRCWVWVKLLRSRLLPEILARWFVDRLEARVKQSKRGASF